MNGSETKAAGGFAIRVSTVRWVAVGLLVAGVIVGWAGCGAKDQKSAAHNRKEAEHAVAEAKFAMNMRDWPRAEGLLATAAKLVPDNGQYWTTLGLVRLRQGNKAGTKEAYLKALKVYEAESDKTTAGIEPWLKQVYVLGLLGRANDGRALLEKIGRKFPNDRKVQAFIAEKQFEKMLADPEYTQAAL